MRIALLATASVLVLAACASTPPAMPAAATASKPSDRKSVE
jgi:starvation-inducible outer membrane lipoprotein